MGPIRAQQVRRALEAWGDPLSENIFRAARWLRTSSRNAAWRPAAMRSLASLLQQDGHPMALRARAMMALIASGDPGVALLLNQMLASGSESQQVLAALGLGYSQYGQAVASMSNLVDGSSPAAGRAACLAWALVHGGDAARQAAAEALARHADEGHAILKEASQMDNLLVRRACIAGLAQIQQSWAVQRVETMSLEDKEWVVRSAASQALDLLNSPERRLPDPLPGLAETPWLIAFASEHGLGVSPGKPAEELIRRALAEGNAAQKFAAIEYLGLFGQPDDAPRLLRIQQECDGALREAALHALWLLAASGKKIVS